MMDFTFKYVNKYGENIVFSNEKENIYKKFYGVMTDFDDETTEYKESLILMDEHETSINEVVLFFSNYLVNRNYNLYAKLDEFIYADSGNVIEEVVYTEEINKQELLRILTQKMTELWNSYL